MKRKRVYIAGPMTGLPNYNREAFFAAAETLRVAGFDPVHTADMPDGLEYKTYIKRSKKLLKTCDAVCLLDGWNRSNGVMKHELPLALKRGMQVVELKR